MIKVSDLEYKKIYIYIAIQNDSFLKLIEIPCIYISIR